ncbi:cation:proton antiporter [Nitrolancea hollandica]|uniref:Sodium/hydrogen exchanger n=1 Tax=Nitrolancea hollandica Lb TaxID=1129897 RepID=I4EH09_9BACT|nr:cation:proton antiporter [Nitrolancea hollandica]CCF83971.1 Sodium/hydrogen exchanger [Nitrolancea hollandica Lb]
MGATASILADLFILFVAARVAGALFVRLNQPAVIGELLAGILIGPFAFGWVGTADPVLVEAFHGNTASAQEALDLVLDIFAELGVVILLFFVGLETRLSDLIGVGWRAALVGTLGILVPFVAGYGLLVLWGSSTPTALFIAAALVSTSTGITARVLRDLGVLHSREARIILGAAVIDDILAMILLATVTQLGPQRDIDLLDIGLIAAQAIGFTIFVALIGTRAISHVHAHLKRLPFTHGPLIVALALMLGLATVATRVGLAAIIGAFLAGIVMSEEAERSDLEQVILPIYEFLVPFFFVIIGTRVDPALFLDRQIIGQALIITGLAIVAKVAGAVAGGIGMGLRSMAMIGIGMVPRGEVGLIVASLGLSRGIIGTEFFSMVVVMSIVTTLIVPPVLSWLSQPRVRRPAPVRGERMGATGRLPGM